VSGDNNLESAKAAMLGFPYTPNGFDLKELALFELDLNQAAEEFNKESKLINVYLFSQGGL